MSNTLLIRHLCGELSTLEREDFLKHFGAQKVWFINPNSHTAFASFQSKTDAESALIRLHQLEILGKRLIVEYSNETNGNQYRDKAQKDLKQVKQFINSLNSWNPSVGLSQPPPPCLKYNYPSASPQILLNIMYTLQTNKSFYIQTLHLMNKMGLDPPFEGLRENIKSYIEESLCDIGINLRTQEPHPPTKINCKENNSLSSEESEISSSEDIPSFDDYQIPKKRPKLSNSKQINKKPRLLNQSLHIPNTERKKTILNKKEVFEEIPLQEIKKIEVKVNQSQILNTNHVRDNTEIIGTIGKIYPTPSSVLQEDGNQSKTLKMDKPRESGIVSSKELLDNKISLKDMKSLSIFKNYHPGTPSMRLYIKNLSKDVDILDLERIYKRYVVDCNVSEKDMFSIRVMQEGRMKGQAFVSLPSVELSQKAVSETNGFILKNKPMVVQFARTAK